MQVKTIEIHGENEFATTKTRVACRGVVIKDALMLISHEVNTDQFFIPGGGLEVGETLEECCAREVQEETGYVVRPNRHFLTIHEFYEEYEYVSHYFICEVIGKKGTAPYGIGKGKWTCSGMDFAPRDVGPVCKAW